MTLKDGFCIWIICFRIHCDINYHYKEQVQDRVIPTELKLKKSPSIITCPLVISTKMRSIFKREKKSGGTTLD